jgi:hypothetical protein
MRRNFLYSGVALIALTISLGGATGNSTIMVEIRPAVRLSPSHVSLTFVVTDDGVVTATQSVPVVAWVRSFPNQQISLTARAGELIGPVGSISSTAIKWSSATADMTGGGQNARCVNGNFSTGPEQALITNWLSSGTVTCSVSFSLDPGAKWAPGSYTGFVDFAVAAK